MVRWVDGAEASRSVRTAAERRPGLLQGPQKSVPTHDRCSQQKAGAPLRESSDLMRETGGPDTKIITTGLTIVRVSAPPGQSCSH
jgi:hypothetical protein